MMRSLNTFPEYVIGFICCWQLLLIGGSIWILIVGMREKRRLKPALRNSLFILLTGVNYILFQCTGSYLSDTVDTEKIRRLSETFAQMPVCVLLILCFIITVIESSILFSINHWYNTHITSASIKEIIETLPVGICAYEKTGKITLKNKTMEQICRHLAQTALLNGNDFMQLLQEKKSNLAGFVVELGDYGIWSFTHEQLEDGNNQFFLLIAYDVTEAYEKTRMLHEKQQMVRELNTKLEEYNKRIKSVITAQEILNAKIRIHDELGEGLLAIRRYLTVGGTEKERTEMLERLKENVRFLRQESMTDEQDEYELMLTTAEKLGVTVLVDGSLPGKEPHKHVVATAIHECFTNILRHTDGDTLFISVSENDKSLNLFFTDNNSRPVEDISEKGGLCSLRMLTQQAGGEMLISSEPKFKLTITLPKEFS